MVKGMAGRAINAGGIDVRRMWTKRRSTYGVYTAENVEVCREG